MDNIKAVFVGHDHNNDFCGDYYGVSLCYGRKTGYGSYGPPDGMQRGARILEFSLRDDTIKFDSWIRQEDGSLDFQTESHQSNVTQPQCVGMSA